MMAVSFSCPISGNKRDNTVARIVAGLSFIVALVAIVIAQVAGPIPAAIIIGLLAVDFLIRAFYKPRFSPLATLGRGIVSAFNLSPNLVDSAPKIFAARIGVAFAVVSFFLFLFGQVLAASFVLGILLLCAFLEAAFSFCLGCKVYSILPQKAGNLLARDFTHHE